MVNPPCDEPATSGDTGLPQPGGTITLDGPAAGQQTAGTCPGCPRWPPGCLVILIPLSTTLPARQCAAVAESIADHVTACSRLTAEFPLGREQPTWPGLRTMAETASPGETTTPVRSLAALRAELAALGVTTSGLAVTRLQGTLTLAGGPAIRYRRGWLIWPAGPADGLGRPAIATHRAEDPAGAARRLAARI